jgi:hypothetical protein
MMPLVFSLLTPFDSTLHFLMGKFANKSSIYSTRTFLHRMSTCARDAV